MPIILLFYLLFKYCRSCNINLILVSFWFQTFGVRYFNFLAVVICLHFATFWLFMCITFIYFGPYCLIFQQLINNLDRDLQYAIRVEGKMDVDFVSNYEEVKNAIMEKVIFGLIIKFQLVLTSNSRISVS